MGFSQGFYFSGSFEEVGSLLALKEDIVWIKNEVKMREVKLGGMSAIVPRDL